MGSGRSSSVGAGAEPPHRELGKAGPLFSGLSHPKDRWGDGTPAGRWTVPRRLEPASRAPAAGWGGTAELLFRGTGSIESRTLSPRSESDLPPRPFLPKNTFLFLLSHQGRKAILWEGRGWSRGGPGTPRTRAREEERGQRSTRPVPPLLPCLYQRRRGRHFESEEEKKKEEEAAAGGRMGGGDRRSHIVRPPGPARSRLSAVEKT